MILSGYAAGSYLNVEVFFRRFAQHPAAENDQTADQNKHYGYTDDCRRDDGIDAENDRNDL